MIIKLLENDNERQKMYGLVYDEYIKQGYILPNESSKFEHYQGIFDRNPNTDVFLVYENNDITGTISFTRDSWTHSIPSVIDFPKETDEQRLLTSNLANTWRLVTKEEYRSNLSFITILLKEIIKRAIVLGVECTLASINPKHVGCYINLLNMEMIGFTKKSEGLQNAPSVLMRSFTRDIPQRWLK